MSSILSAERTPADEASEKPIRERQLAAYYRALDYIDGRHVLEIGCGEGIGTSILKGKARYITALDYSEKALKFARSKYTSENVAFTLMKVPPLVFANDLFDAVVCFQMIEHLEEPGGLVEEIKRVLRKDGVALIATVNKDETISDNPYHLHEFVEGEFRELLMNHFGSVELYGVFGDDLFMRYWLNNRNWVNTFMRMDIFGISNHLPQRLKQRLFSVASWIMRIGLKRGEPELCNSITHKNFLFRKDILSGCLDFFAVCRKSR